MTDPRIEYRTARTQKAKGLAWIRGAVKKNSLATLLVQEEHEVEEAWRVKEAIIHVEAFARPCPMKPRHGFLDSRPVHSTADLKKLLKEARKLDEQAEIVLQPLVDAKWNAIITPTTFAIGEGNDGATSGGKNSFSLKLAGKKPFFEGHKPTVFGIDSGSVQYVELVNSLTTGTAIVQVRGGPPLEACEDFIPQSKVKVKAVVVITGKEDLLEWESTAAALPKGTVVWHEKGNVSSHFGVHCVLNSVPYITSHKPSVGEVLEATDDNAIDVDAMVRGLAVGLTAKPNYANAVKLAAFSLHNFGADRGKHGAFFAGVGAAFLYRLLAMLCIGEMRHWRGAREQSWLELDGSVGRLKRHPDSKLFTEFLSLKSAEEFAGSERTSIYVTSWKHPEKDMQPILLCSAQHYLDDVWSRGYGGPMWGQCTVCALDLRSKITALLRKPSDRRARILMAAFNETLNMAHNGGWVFNKIANSATLDYVSEGCRYFLGIEIADVLWNAHNAKVPSSVPLLDHDSGPWRDKLTPRMWVRAVFAKEITKAESDDFHAKQEKAKLANGYKNAMEYITAAIGSALSEKWHGYFNDMYGEEWWKYVKKASVYIDSTGKKGDYIVETVTKGESTWQNW